VYGTVKQTLTDNKPLLEQVARILLEKEVIEGEELRRLVSEYREKERREPDDESQHRKKADRSHQ
jgi:ATP-dependent Zn protease